MMWVIKSAIAPLYRDANARSERVDEALHGMTVMVLDKIGDWRRVRTEYHYEGWVHRKRLAKTAPMPEMPRYMIIAPAADILAAPKVQSTTVTCLTLGCRVHGDNITENAEWTRVTLADGRTGYIRTEFLAPCPEVRLEVTESASLRASICDTAKRYMGTQYRWGGKTAQGIDCSGLCFMAYWLNGITIYRDAQINPDFAIKKIPPSTAKEGDLLFFPGHVGILLKDGTMLHSSQKGNGVKAEALTPEWKSNIIAAGSVFATA